MNKTIIEGYLTQQKLEVILKNESSFIFEQSEAPVPNSRLRFDFLLTDKKTNQKIAVEFNGYQHYTKTSVIVNDWNKRHIAKEHNIKLVEIPYFVQLNDKTFKHYFGKAPQTPIIQNYPHGFIDKKAVLPADFCSLGVERFIKETVELPKAVLNELQDSLLNKICDELRFPNTVYPLDLLEDEIWELYDKAYLEAANEIVGSFSKKESKKKN